MWGLSVAFQPTKTTKLSLPMRLEEDLKIQIWKKTSKIQISFKACLIRIQLREDEIKIGTWKMT